jgi:hypothetical protein
VLDDVAFRVVVVWPYVVGDEVVGTGAGIAGMDHERLLGEHLPRYAGVRRERVVVPKRRDQWLFGQDKMFEPFSSVEGCPQEGNVNQSTFEAYDVLRGRASGDFDLDVLMAITKHAYDGRCDVEVAGDAEPYP